MKSASIFYIFSSLLWASMSSAQSIKLKYEWDQSCPKEPQSTVCYLTLNSDNEREVFQKNLMSEPSSKCQFKHIEMANYINSKNSSTWFKDLCESKLTCDVLVISGHYAGSFFGEKTIPGTDINYELDINTMLNQSCKNTCDGILKQPIKTYLFGCNTLADKSIDNRIHVNNYLSAEEINNLKDTECKNIYKNTVGKKITNPALAKKYDMLRYKCDLKHIDNIPSDSAERITAHRYSDIGFSFKELSQWAFKGSGDIYGFDSRSPSGKNIEPILKQYFKKEGKNFTADYQDKAATRALNLVDESSDAFRSNNTEDPFYKLLLARQTAIAHCTGLDPNLNDADRELYCDLISDRLKKAEKLSRIADALDKPNAEAFLPAIEKFFSSNYFDDLSPQDKDYLESLKQNENLKKIVTEAIKKSELFPYELMKYLNLAEHLGMIDKSERQKIAETKFKDIVMNQHPGDISAICKQRTNYIIPKIPNLNYGLEVFPGKQIQNARQARLAQCLGSNNKELNEEVVDFINTHPLTEKEYVQLVSLKAKMGFSSEAEHNQRRREVLEAARAASSKKDQTVLYKAYLSGKKTNEVSQWLKANFDVNHPAYTSMLDYLTRERIADPELQQKAYYNFFQKPDHMNELNDYFQLVPAASNEFKSLIMAEMNKSKEKLKNISPSASNNSEYNKVQRHMNSHLHLFQTQKLEANSTAAQEFQRLYQQYKLEIGTTHSSLNCHALTDSLEQLSCQNIQKIKDNNPIF